MKRIFFLATLIFQVNISFCQLKIIDLDRFNIGDDDMSKISEITKLVNAPSTLMKSNQLSSVYFNEYENTTFNFCENARITFLYVNDKLYHLNITLKYTYDKEKNETAKYRLALETLINGFKEKNYLYSFQPKLSDLSLKRVNQKVDSSYFILNKKGKLKDNGLALLNGTNVYFVKYNSGDPRIIYLSTIIDKTISHPETNSGLNDPVYFKMLEKYQNDNHFVAKAIDDTAKIDYWINIDLSSNKYQDEQKYSTSGTLTIIPQKKEITLIIENGIYKLPVLINGIVSLNFILDLGASDVSISPDVFAVLIRDGSITESDYIGSETYSLADGTTAKSRVFNLKSLKIGEIILKNVRASVSNNIKSPLLLGQSALLKLKSYRIDNFNNKLIIEE